MANTALALWDKILPDQAINNLYDRGTRESYHRRLYETLAAASGVTEPRSDFDLELTDVVPLEEMASNPLALRLLHTLVELTRAERVLEIGAYIGISTMTLARALPPGGKVISIEKFPVFADICRRNFARNHLSDRIELHVGDAWEVLPGLALDRPLDLAFIDGDKERYLDYFEAIEPRVRPGGLIVVDDILFQGDVLNPTAQTQKGAGVARFLDYAAQKLDWTRVALPFSDGIMLLIKPHR